MLTHKEYFLITEILDPEIHEDYIASKQTEIKEYEAYIQKLENERIEKLIAIDDEKYGY